jgi:hypothetical protein
MRNLERRLTALEAITGRIDDSCIIAFMIDGASDDDVIAVRGRGAYLERLPGETLAELVDRVKALQPLAENHVMFFEYPDELRARLGKEYMPETLPNSWPIPSSSGHACHVEHRP